MSSEYEDIVVEVKEEHEAGLLTLSRPHVHNALNQNIRLEIQRCLEAWTTDDRVTAVVITGAGARSFSTGADIKDKTSNHSTSDFAEYAGAAPSKGQWYRTLLSYPKPVIAAVNGYAAGSGLQLALAADLMLASTSATFWLPQMALGLVPEAGSLARLLRAIGAPRTRDLVLTGRRLKAEEAIQWGLVREVLEPEELVPRALELAHQVGSVPRAAFAAARQMLKAADELGWEQLMNVEFYKEFATWQTAERQARHEAFAARADHK